MINFTEHPHTGYALRTRDNVLLSDATLAFAADFKSPGEILTHKCCVGASKPYIKIDISEYTVMWQRQAQEIADMLRQHNVKCLNIAGNSISTLRGKYQQVALDRKVADCMNKIHAIYPLESVRTGGQSGADLSGAIWADSIDLPVTVLAPKGWMFRNVHGQDICNEYEFIKRFGDRYDLSDIL